MRSSCPRTSSLAKTPGACRGSFIGGLLQPTTFLAPRDRFIGKIDAFYPCFTPARRRKRADWRLWVSTHTKEITDATNSDSLLANASRPGPPGRNGTGGTALDLSRILDRQRYIVAVGRGQ